MTEPRTSTRRLATVVAALTFLATCVAPASAQIEPVGSPYEARIDDDRVIVGRLMIEQGIVHLLSAWYNDPDSVSWVPLDLNPETWTYELIVELVDEDKMMFIGGPVDDDRDGGPPLDDVFFTMMAPPLNDEGWSSAFSFLLDDIVAEIYHSPVDWEDEVCHLAEDTPQILRYYFRITDRELLIFTIYPTGGVEFVIHKRDLHGCWYAVIFPVVGGDDDAPDRDATFVGAPMDNVVGTEPPPVGPPGGDSGVAPPDRP